LAQQPTILFQLSGVMDVNQAVVDATASGKVVGLTGGLDPDHPLDVLLAIPPEHYFEYDPENDGYFARFYDDEGFGGVFGANAMMGHDVFFDVENHRIGWAESSCDYSALETNFTSSYQEPKPPEDPSRVESSETNEDASSLCSGLACQIGVFATLLATVVSLVVVRVNRCSPSGSAYEYELAQSELELQETVSVGNTDVHSEEDCESFDRRQFTIN
jgi:hypothetical protein